MIIIHHDYLKNPTQRGRAQHLPEKQAMLTGNSDSVLFLEVSSKRTKMSNVWKMASKMF